MFEVDEKAVTKWVAVGSKRKYAPQAIDIICPNHKCRRSLVNLSLSWVDAGNFMWAQAKCAWCEELVRLFLIDPPQKKDDAGGQSHLYVYPSPPLHPPVEDGIEDVSPAFINIYSQAVMAESLNLDELNGIGYRKAIEFLIKDYLCSKYPDKADEIKGKFLSRCIKDHVDDPKIKDCAEMAVWLGNDETHYVRKWKDRDMDDLKMLMQLTLYWISSELLTEKYKPSMSKT